MAAITESKPKCIKCGKVESVFWPKNALYVKHALLHLCESCTKKLLKRMKYIPESLKKFIGLTIE